MTSEAGARGIGRTREDIRRRLRRGGASLAVILAAIVAVGAMTVTDSFPAAGDSEFASSFVGGFLMGLLACAGAVTARQLVELRRALASDAALRRLHARENDELRAHLEREVARTFVQIIPALAAVIVVAAALAGTEAMVSATATLVFLSVALLLVKLWHKRRLSVPEAE